MPTRRTILRLTLLAATMLAFAGSSIASEDGREFKVIVNPENPIGSVDRDFLRDVYLKKSNEWGGGETIHPIDLASKYPARDRFTEHVIRKTPAQLRTYWNQQIFSGKGVPPPEAGTVADVIAYVLAHKGAIGYLPADADPGRAKMISIR